MPSVSINPARMNVAVLQVTREMAEVDVLEFTTHADRTGIQANAPITSVVSPDFASVYLPSFWMERNVDIHVTGNSVARIRNVFSIPMVLSVNVNLERQGMPTQAVPTLTSVPPCYLLILMDRVELLPSASTSWDPIDVNAREDHRETPTLSPDALVPPNASLIITVQTTHFATEQPASVRMRVWQPFVDRMQSAFLADIRDTVSVGLVLQEIQTIRCMDVNHHVMGYFAQMVRPVSSVLRVMEFASVTMDWLGTPGLEEHVLLTTRVLYKDLV